MVEWHKRTKQWHHIYNLVILGIFGFLYVNGLPELSFTEAMSTGYGQLSASYPFPVMVLC